MTRLCNVGQSGFAISFAFQNNCKCDLSTICSASIFYHLSSTICITASHLAWVFAKLIGNPNKCSKTRVKLMPVYWLSNGTDYALFWTYFFFGFWQNSEIINQFCISNIQHGLIAAFDNTYRVPLTKVLIGICCSFNVLRYGRVGFSILFSCSWHLGINVLR